MGVTAAPFLSLLSPILVTGMKKPVLLLLCLIAIRPLAAADGTLLQGNGVDLTLRQSEAPLTDPQPPGAQPPNLSLRVQTTDRFTLGLRAELERLNFIAPAVTENLGSSFTFIEYRPQWTEHRLWEHSVTLLAGSHIRSSSLSLAPALRAETGLNYLMSENWRIKTRLDWDMAGGSRYNGLFATDRITFRIGVGYQFSQPPPATPLPVTGSGPPADNDGPTIP